MDALVVLQHAVDVGTTPHLRNDEAAVHAVDDLIELGTAKPLASRLCWRVGGLDWVGCHPGDWSSSRTVLPCPCARCPLTRPK